MFLILKSCLRLWDVNSNLWVDSKNVTDYDANEVGGFPTVTTSANRVHVSYNSGYGLYASSNYGNAKTRDYNFNTQSWETPQQLYGLPSGESMVEKAFADGNYLYLFYYKIVSGMGNYHSDLYQTKRTLNGSTWDPPILLKSYADVTNKIELATTADGKLHAIYPASGIQYRNYDGTNWSSEQLLSAFSGVNASTMSKAGNDLYCFWREGGGLNGNFVTYRQYNAAPLTPQEVAVGPLNNSAQVTWIRNPEPDIAGYDIYRDLV